MLVYLFLICHTFATMNKRTGGLIVVGIILVVLYFFNRKDIELSPATAFHIHRISATGGELQEVIHLSNPNLLSSTIKTIHEKIYLNGILLGILDNELSQGIPGLKDTEFPVSIRFSNADYQRAVGTDSLGVHNVAVTIEGEIQFQNLFKSGKIEIHQSAPVTNDTDEK